MKLNLEKVRPIVEAALREDIGEGDITTELMIPPDLEAQAAIVTREDCLVCGLQVAELVFKNVDAHLKVELLVQDGEGIRSQSDLLSITGRASSILTAERTALNFLQRLCGIASLTAAYVEKVKKYKVAILDTRKTTPGIRLLEKYAVSVGGGQNHRFGLDDEFLIKENHLALSAKVSARSLAAAVKKARERYPKKWVEVEVSKMEELIDAVQSQPDAILLDNLSVEEMKQAVTLIGDKIVKEASGNIGLDNVEEVAATGVDRISIGRLTHSVRSIDMGLEWVGMEHDVQH